VQKAPDVYELSRQTALTVAQRFMIHPSNSVIRRDAFVRAGGFFNHLWSHAEDLNLMLRVLDTARGTLYIADTVARYRLPAGDSISLTEVEGIHFLQKILASQQARLHCHDPDFRRCARAREAWTYRELASYAARAGQRRDAGVFAAQCFATYPTFGAIGFALKTWLR
jgi:hypothetical protein